MRVNVKREYTAVLSVENFRKAMFRLIFDQENRLRVLEGKAQLTKKQFINAIEKDRKK